MIKIKFYQKINDKKKVSLQKITLLGHATFRTNNLLKNEKQNIEANLICAGVSSIVFGLMNFIENFANKKIKIIKFDNKINFIILKNDKLVRIIFKILFIQLKTLKTKYPNYIKIIF